MDTTFEPQQLSAQNIIIYLLDKLPVDSPSSSLPFTGFYQPSSNDPAKDFKLTFRQLFHDLGLAFKWAAYDTEKSRAHTQNAYAAGLVLLSRKPENGAPGYLGRTSEDTIADGNTIVNLTDFSDIIVPVGSYTLLRHDERRCRSHVDLLKRPVTTRTITTTISTTSSYFTSSSSSSSSSVPCSPPSSCLALHALASGFRDPRGSTCCISNVSLDLYLLHLICSSQHPSIVIPPLDSPKKRKRSGTAQTNSIMSRLATVENPRACLGSVSLDLPIGRADVNPDSMYRDPFFRAAVTKRDQCCRLTGQKILCAPDYYGPPIDTCYIVPFSKPNEWSDDPRLAMWSERVNPTLQPWHLDTENVICLRGGLRYPLDAYLWSVHLATFKVRVFVNIDRLLPFHGQDIRLRLPYPYADLPSTNDGPPADVWHYQQCVLRMLRGSTAPPSLRSLGDSWAQIFMGGSEHKRPRTEGPTMDSGAQSRSISLTSPSPSPSRDIPTSRYAATDSRHRGLTPEQIKLWV